MADGTLVIGTRRYSSWSLRGWLAVRLAGLDVEVQVIPLQGHGGTTAIKQATPAGLVPFLRHDGAEVWESLALCEYCAELAPGLWPQDRAARAAARSIAAEMHAGFADLRRQMPMNLGRQRRLAPSPATAVDIARVEAVWRAARTRTGFLYSDGFGAADAMYAPVVTRLLSYEVDLAPDSAAYCQAVRQHKLMQEWYAAAAAEPASWQLAHYEAVA